MTNNERLIAHLQNLERIIKEHQDTHPAPQTLKAIEELTKDSMFLLGVVNCLSYLCAAEPIFMEKFVESIALYSAALAAKERA